MQGYLYIGGVQALPTSVVSSGGGGDTVTATNTTGNAIASGDKVWLIYDTSTSDGITDYLTYSTQNVVTNNIIDSFSDNFLIYSSTSYKGNINWTNLELSLGASTSISSLQRAFYTNEGGFVFDNGSASKYYKNNNITSLGYTWYVLGGLVTNNRVNRYMTYYDCVDGVIDTSKSFITNDATGVSTENVFYLRTYNEWYWLNNRYGAINIRGVKNPSFDGSTYSTDSDIVVNTNGCTTQIGITSDDKYILLCDGSYNRADSDSNAATHFTILKRNSYKNFSPVTTNLPTSMQDWLQDQSTVRQFLYNPMNDVLICTDLSTAKKLSIYKYISSTETWEEVSIAVNSFIPNEYPFVKNVSISAGLDKLLLQCSENASDTTKRLFAVKLAANGKWFIIPFTNITTASISGYASENIAVFGTGDVNIGVDLTPTKKYKLLDRIKDDSNNEIGTVSGFFTDANDVEYAVVCLDAQYRLASGQIMSSGSQYNVPLYNNMGVWDAKETATTNTIAILAAGTSSACTHCRNQSFTIDGITYYGQLPNMPELTDIYRNRTVINSSDTSASSYSSLVLANNKSAWSSTQYYESYSWCINNYGDVYASNITDNYFVVPVLEIPNT